MKDSKPFVLEVSAQMYIFCMCIEIAHLELFQIIVTCSTTVPEVVHNVTTPLCQLFHILSFSCLQDMHDAFIHTSGIYCVSTNKLTSFKAFLSFLALHHMSIQWWILGCFTSKYIKKCTCMYLQIQVYVLYMYVNTSHVQLTKHFSHSR